jgi:hypothetical protein
MSKFVTPVHNSIAWMVDQELRDDLIKVGQEEDIRGREPYSNVTYHLYKACLYAYMGSVETGDTNLMAIFVKILMLLKGAKNKCTN